MGTAPLAATVLTTLIDSRVGQVVAVVSQPDKPKGRDLKVQPTAVKEVATAAGRPVMQPLKARDAAFIEQIRSLAPDLAVVAAYGQILPQSLLDVPRLGCLNVHTSILPKYRGAAPIQWAILNGDEETGVTIMKMDAGLDTGPVLSEARTPILPEDDAQTLHDRLAVLGGELLVKTIPQFASGALAPTPQPQEGATYARKITREDGRLDWTQPARSLWNKIRALTPWPGTFTFLQRGEGALLLKVWRAEPVPGSSAAPGTVVRAGREGIVVACGDGCLNLREVQRENARRMPAEQFLAGNPIVTGDRFA